MKVTVRMAPMIEANQITSHERELLAENKKHNPAVQHKINT